MLFFCFMHSRFRRSLFLLVPSVLSRGSPPHRLASKKKKRLPGNPASAAVTFALVVAPVLRKLAGWPRPLPRRIGVELDRDTPTDAHRPEYARAAVRWEEGGGVGARAGGEGEGGGRARQQGEEKEGNGGGRLVATNTGNQISSRLLSMKGADVLLELPAGAGVVRSGSVVSALLYGDLRAMK